MKENVGKTAFDYIKKPTNSREKIFSDRMYGSLRVLEVAQVVRNEAEIVQYSYKNNSNILKITIKGSDCDSFLFPKNTTCISLPPR